MNFRSTIIAPGRARRRRAAGRRVGVSPDAAGQPRVRDPAVPRAARDRVRAEGRALRRRRRARRAASRGLEPAGGLRHVLYTGPHTTAFAW
eukprot:2756-Pelagococcus_subviridis.AAC.2